MVHEIMNAPITDYQLANKKRLLQNTFQDLKDDWPQIAIDTRCIYWRPEHHSDLERLDLQKFYDLIRHEVKLHYSDRILILAQHITSSYIKEWEGMSQFESLKKLHNMLKLDVGEQLLVQRFNLDTGFLYATEFSSEKSKLLTAIHEEVHNIRNKVAETLSALKRFDLYQQMFGNSSSN